MPAIAAASAKPELTLHDRLSHLNYRQACRLLGADGEALLRLGGQREICIAEDVYLGGDLFRLRLDGAVVTITPMAEADQHLRWNCTQCTAACEHVGAALALVLEEKLALGLAAPPPVRTPVEALGEEELIRQALRERQERAQTERMTARSTNSQELWTDYLVTSAESGKTYRVALRGWEPGDSYCSCPDFRKNTLGTCKHILNVQRKVRPRFSAAACQRPYRPEALAVHLRYGRELELRLLVPTSGSGRRAPEFGESVLRLVRPLCDHPIVDIPDLVARIAKLEAMGHHITIYPDAEEYIDQQLFQQRMEALVSEIRQAPRQHRLRTELLKVELLPYQLDGIAFAAGAGRAILADDMGLGKTIQGIGVAELLARETAIRRVLVVCPASLKSQWRSEIQRFSSRACQLVLGSAAQRAQQYVADCFFTICNYEQVLRDFLAIERVRWDLIVLDEGQRIKNWEAQTSRVLKALRSPFALVLSGTPLENRLEDLYSVVEFVDDRRLGPAFRFLNRHRVVDETGKVLGYRNLAELRQRLAPILLRRTRAAVIGDLPPRTTEVVRIAPSEEQSELHKANLRIVRSIVRKPYINEMDLLRLRKALLMCRMAADSTYLVDKQAPGYSTKLAALDELLGGLLAEDDRKLLLFSEWTTMLGLIEPLLQRRGVEYVRLDGSVPQKQRQPLVHTFQKSPKCRLFITTNAGATGLNLQAANTVVNVDLPWNPAVLEQRIGRAHRMGQQRPVQVYVLITEGTLEENLLATLSTKRDLALAALDVESAVDTVDLASGMDELKNRLEVLLGVKAEAAVDESEQTRQTEQAARLSRPERIALAGGQMLSAACALLGELLPPREESAEARQLTETMKQRLAECLTQDDHGRLKLTLTLPDPSALDHLAQSLAGLLAIRP